MGKKIKVLRKSRYFELRRIIENRGPRLITYYQIAARGGNGEFNYKRYKRAVQQFTFIAF